MNLRKIITKLCNDKIIYNSKTLGAFPRKYTLVVVANISGNKQNAASILACIKLYFISKS